MEIDSYKISEYNEIPDLTCPECEKEWYEDDMQNPEKGDEHECPECGEISKVTLVEWSCHINLEATGRKGYGF